MEKRKKHNHTWCASDADEEQIDELTWRLAEAFATKNQLPGHLRRKLREVAGEERSELREEILKALKDHFKPDVEHGENNDHDRG